VTFFITRLYNLSDIAGYLEYAAKSKLVSDRFGGRVLVASSVECTINCLEGPRPDVVNILVFSESSNADKFYVSEEYSELKAYRNTICDSHICTVTRA
jgi:uncharacterized protein (DUF1330 family)